MNCKFILNIFSGLCEARAVHSVPGDPANSRRQTAARLHSQCVFHKSDSLISHSQSVFHEWEFLDVLHLSCILRSQCVFHKWDSHILHSQCVFHKWEFINVLHLSCILYLQCVFQKWDFFIRNVFFASEILIFHVLNVSSTSEVLNVLHFVLCPTFAMCLSKVSISYFTCAICHSQVKSFKFPMYLSHKRKITFIIPWCQNQTCLKNLYLITEIPIYGFALESKQIFMAGLQGEAGGDVRFNSEGDAVSNAHTISKEMPTLSQKQCSHDISNAHYI